MRAYANIEDERGEISPLCSPLLPSLIKKGQKKGEKMTANWHTNNIHQMIQCWLSFLGQLQDNNMLNTKLYIFTVAAML